MIKICYESIRVRKSTSLYEMPTLRHMRDIYIGRRKRVNSERETENRVNVGKKEFEQEGE